MLSKPLLLFAWLIVVAVASGLRLSHLEERPMHADEATGARIVAQRLSAADYTFNPSHFHGPTLSLIGAFAAKLNGESTWAELSTLSLRRTSALAGILVVLTPLLWRRVIGDAGALLSGALLATSPLLVYYSRVFIHEIWLVLFGLLSLGFLYRWLTDRRYTDAVATGLWIGLMFATKETCMISLLGWGVAALLLLALQGDLRRLFPLYGKTLLWLFITAAVLSTLLYTDLFKNPIGIVDAFRTYFVYEVTGGHEKSGLYYLQQLIQPKKALGLWWTEVAVALLGLLAGIAAMRVHNLRLPVAFITIGFVGHWLIYSLIAYKTPWLMLLPWAIACLLSGFGVNYISSDRPALSWATAALICLSLGFQVKQSIAGSQLFENDSRNPYAYVPTSKDTAALAKWLAQLQVFNSADDPLPIAVTGSGYWPLPWYLRTFPTVGYWPSVEPTQATYPVIIALPDQEAAAQTLFETTHTPLPRGLRHNVSITIYVENALWERWLEDAPPTP